MEVLQTTLTEIGLDCGKFWIGFIACSAGATSLITEAVKEAFDNIPTKLVCYIVSLVVTPVMFIVMMTMQGNSIQWQMVIAMVLLSFLVAKIAMGGWDDVTELLKRLSGKG